MVMLSSDVEDVYHAILKKKATYEEIRILTSALPHDTHLLKIFPNIEDIYCPIICDYTEYPSLDTYLSQLSKLTYVTFITYLPKSEITKKRSRNLTPLEKTLKIYLPTFVKNLGYQLKYLQIIFNLYDNDNGNRIRISLINGKFYGFATDTEDNIEKLFIHTMNALSEVKILQSIRITGEIEYNFNKIKKIPEIILMAINHPHSKYLKTLINKTETITVEFSPETLEEINIYSEIIRQGSNGQLKKIFALLPICDISEHIHKNINLEEIYIYMRDKLDVFELDYILNQYVTRDIVYHVFYYKGAYEDYWSILPTKGNIIIYDLVKELNT